MQKFERNSEQLFSVTVSLYTKLLVKCKVALKDNEMNECVSSSFRTES
jgi:hypothetical protein